MQSWGTRSRFTERDTELEPSKSGVIGLLCAALGLPRSVPVDQIPNQLAGLRMGVRVDHEGHMANDYHTAGGGGTGIMRASGKLSTDAVLSNRYYLAEADFLGGLEADGLAALERLEAALHSPRWQLFLGRKSFVPSVPVHLPGGGIRSSDLQATLEAEPWPLQPIAFARGQAVRPRLRYVLEREPGATSEVRMDQPIGAAFEARSFGPRWVETRFSGAQE